MPDEEDPDDPGEVTSNGGTTTSSYRYKYLSTIVTILVTTAYLVFVLSQKLAPAAGVETGTLPGGTWATFNIAFLGVLAYSVGVDTIRAAAEVWGGQRG